MEELGVTNGQDSLVASQLTILYRLDSLSQEVEVRPLSVEEGISTYFGSSSFLNIKEFAPYVLLTSPVEDKSQKLFRLVPGKQGAPLHHTVQQQVWFMPIMLVMFALYGWIYKNFSKLMVQDFKEFFYPNGRENVPSYSVGETSRMKVLLHIISVFSVSIFAYFVLVDFFHYTPRPFGISFLGVLLVFVIYVIFKMLTMRLLCYVFFNRDVLSSVRSYFSTITSTLAMVLFVVSIFAAYAPNVIASTSLYVGLIFCAIAVLLYLYKILSIFFTGMSSLFYLILYLCTLEILPAIVLVLTLVGIV